jgi:hypothetical protein
MTELKLDGTSTRQCPCARCSQPVEVCSLTETTAENLNKLCRAMGQPPLEDDEIVLCEACYSFWQAEETARAQQAYAKAVEARAQYRANHELYGPAKARGLVPLEYSLDDSFLRYCEAYDQKQRSRGRRKVGV